MKSLIVIALSFLFYNPKTIAGTVYTSSPVPEPFSYTRCENLLEAPEAINLYKQFDPSNTFGKCHINVDVTQDTLSLFSLANKQTEAWAEFSKLGEDRLLKLKDKDDKTIWQIPIPRGPAYHSRPNVPSELEAKYSNHFYDFIVLKETPHIRLYLSSMSEGRGGVFILGLDVPCDHVSKFLANDPVTAREYSVLETDSQKICRVPVMHFYEVLPSASK